VWSTSSISNLLRNHVYVGRLYYNQTEATPDPRHGGRARQRPRPKEQWIAIPVPAIVSDDAFDAAEKIGGRNAYFSPRRTKPGVFLLRGLVRCGHCETVVSCHRRPKNLARPDGGWNHYYYCRQHDPLRAGGEERRCPERCIRADSLDMFVFDQVRDALLRPDVLLAAEHAVATGPSPDDNVLDQQLRRLKRKTDAAIAEHRRLVDLYQAGLIELTDLRRRAAEVERRRQSLEEQQRTLSEQRRALGHNNQLRGRVANFAGRVTSALDNLDFNRRQALLRLVVEDVRVSGWDVHIRLRIPLDQPPDGNDGQHGQRRGRGVPSEERLRSLRIYGLRDGEVRCLAKAR
jgi:site-specific DNA recombinase